MGGGGGGQKKEDFWRVDQALAALSFDKHVFWRATDEQNLLGAVKVCTTDTHRACQWDAATVTSRPPSKWGRT